MLMFSMTCCTYLLFLLTPEEGVSRFQVTILELSRTTEFLFINLESQLRLAAEVTGNSLSALLDSHPSRAHAHLPMPKDAWCIYYDR